MATTPTVTPTRHIAEYVVEALRHGLGGANAATIASIRTVFVGGSYVRGDWLDHCSDLDVGVVFRPGCGTVEQTSFGLRYIADAASDPGYRLIQDTITQAMRGRELFSYVRGGVDLMAYPEPPPASNSALEHVGPPAYHVFLFDLAQHHQILFGTPFRIRIEPPPIPAELLARSLAIAAERIAALPDKPRGRRAATNLCHSLIRKAQCHFGEPTLDKTRLLYLFRQHVPGFSTQGVGEFIIRQYLGTYLPLVEPQILPLAELRTFHAELSALVSRSLAEGGRSAPATASA